MTCLSLVATVTTCSDRNEYSSFLLSSERTKSCQFWWSVTDGRTLLLALVPLFSLVLAFKLLGIYSSKTKSSHYIFSRDCLRYGKGFAERRLLHLDGLGNFAVSICFSVQFIWWLLVPDLILPQSDSKGRQP